MNDAHTDEIEESEESSGLDIAIVGMAGRFPGANNIDEFWRLLKEGVEALTYFSDEDLVESGVDPALIADPDYVKSRCIIEDEDKFDAYFFELSPREVEMMDPQHRLFLEIAWQALENAGYNADTYDGLIGLFGGVSLNTYLFSFLMSQKGFVSSAEGYQLSIGNDKDFLNTRISYKMNLKGPSVTVQTACSTSLVAVHTACQNLLNYSCDMALAGGVSITIPQKQGYYYQEGMILSPDGHCRAFDEKSGGTISGNGAGIVVLKRLDEAIEDGDHIYAVIKGSAFNNDGSLRVGYTAPSVDGQAEVIATAQAVSGIDPQTISYIETHGTGTVLGDPIEISALTQVFNEHTDKKNFCAIGSVKTNIGHLDAAAGVAGLIKTALSLQNKKIPASLNYEKPNPKIDFENSPFFVNTELREWKTGDTPRRAGISSFGIGGTNAHAVLEEAPPVEPSDESRPYHLLLLSAKTNTALDNAAGRLADHLKNNHGLNIADTAYTLQVGRKPFNQRRMLVCQSLDDAFEALEKRDPKRLLSMTHTKEPSNPPIAFMFSGQGAQYVNMAKELYETESVFKEHVDQCCDILQPYMGLDLRTLLYPAENEKEEAAKKLDQTVNTQPALFVIEYALAKLWMEWGVKPQAMVGHSIGEYVAACLSGVFSLEDALKVVAARGALMQKMPGGAMLSLPLEEHDIAPFLNDDISLATLNGKDAAVLSGTFEAIESLEKQLTEKNIKYRRLHTSHAFHSPMMDPILDEFTAVVKSVTLNEPQIPYVSNVSGGWIKIEEAVDPEYYARHLRRTVRFVDNAGELLEDSAQILLEVGPGTTLSTLARRHPGNTLGRVILSSVRHPQERQSDQAYLLNTIGRLWLAGASIDWDAYYKNERRLRLPLPTYPFEKQRYWLEAKDSGPLIGMESVDEGKKTDISDWFYLPSWKQRDLPLTPVKSHADHPANWLIFLDDCGLGTQIIDNANPAVKTVITVKKGEAFSAGENNNYVINPQSADDYVKLFEQLNKDEALPDAIIHLWNVSADDEELSFETIQDYGFKSLLFLAKAIGKLNLSNDIQVGVVSNNLFEVTGTETLLPDKASLLGPCKIIPQEYPNIVCRTIDTVLPEKDSAQFRTLASQITAEFLDNRTGLTLAYRANHRWVQDFEPVRLEEAGRTDGLLKENGVYAITGGLGRIGLTLAEHLAKSVKARLVLLEKIEFPEKSGWQEWLNSHDSGDVFSLKIKRLQKIESLGAEILVLHTDISDKRQLEKTLKQAAESFGTINGVIHAAGLVGEQSFKTIREITADDWDAQFQAKVKGAQVLAEVLREYQPDFCLLQSSLSSILGGLGFSAYAAANQFLDAFSYQQNKKSSTQWISVNWDGWQFDETSERQGALGAEIAQLSILPDEGARAFERVFAAKGISQVLISTGNLQSRINKWIKLETIHQDEEAADGELHSRPNLPTAYVEPETELQKQVASEWQKLLGIEPIGIYDDFFDLGGNSLSGTQLISKMRETFQIELPLRSLFEDATISGVTKLIKETQEKSKDSDVGKVADLLKQMENMSDEEAAEALKRKRD